MITFPNINYTLLKSTEWDDPVDVIADQTRCGAKKTRPAAQSSPESYSITLQFPTYADCNAFKAWFRNTLYKGALSFWFPKIDQVDGENTEYRFQAGSKVHYMNVSGKIIRATMIWEEV